MQKNRAEKRIFQSRFFLIFHFKTTTYCGLPVSLPLKATIRHQNYRLHVSHCWKQFNNVFNILDIFDNIFKKPHLLMVQFTVSLANEVFPFYSCVYILHNYSIILKWYFKIRSGLLRRFWKFYPPGLLVNYFIIANIRGWYWICLILNH